MQETTSGVSEHEVPKMKRQHCIQRLLTSPPAAVLGFCIVLHLSGGNLLGARPQLDLTGTWDFYADVGDSALGSTAAKPGKILVPGAWQAQGYGAAGGTIPSANIGPGTSPAEYLRHNLMARCLYVRQVSIPAAWQGQRVFLCVRRAYRYTDVSVNGKRIGEYEGFCSPFEFEITPAISFGRSNQIVIGVDNRPRPGRDTMGTGNLYGNWGGIGGVVYLETRSPTWIGDVFAIPRVKSSAVELQVTLRTAEGSFPDSLKVNAEVRPWNATGEPAAPVGVTNIAFKPAFSQPAVLLPVSIADARLWTPEDPFLYIARVSLMQKGRLVDEMEVRFGLREITAEGGKLLLNGKLFYLSGYGDDATEPITGMLPADKGLYARRLKLMRGFGFNFVRHHSCVPHDEYFQAADEIGMLVQPEAGMAYTGFWRTGRRLFEQEWPGIVKAFRNHPSIWAWCMGNELFLGEFPEKDSNPQAIDLGQPLTNGPLRTVQVEENGVFGPPGQYPTQSFKQSNYYRDVGCLVAGKTLTFLGQARTSRVFKDAPHELGLKIKSISDTPLTLIRYYRVPEEQGVHVGRLWDATGAEVAHVSFTNETPSGWQEAILPAPVILKARQHYLVSVNANTAYVATSPSAGDCTREEVLRLVEKAYRQAKALDPTRLVHASDGGALHEFTDVFSSGGGEKFGPKPLLLHEYGTYCCSLPDLSLIPRLNGVMRPLTYERAERYLREHGLEQGYPLLRRSSLLMRAEAQKHYMESARVSGANQGYSFWLGIDFPESPEGCWDEGILNELWEPKPFLTNNLTHYNGPTVLLTSVGLENRSFYTDQGKIVPLRLWHYGEQPIEGARLKWRVIEGTRSLQSGMQEGISCQPGQTLPLRDVAIERLESAGRSVPRFVTLAVALEKGAQTLAENSWDFYGYPRLDSPVARAGVYSETGALQGAGQLTVGQALPNDLRLLVTRELKRDRHSGLLRAGKAAVLLLGTGGFKEHRAGYFLNQYGAGYGGIIADHPAFAGIPHEGRIHPGLYQLVAGGGVLNAEQMPPALRDGAVVWGLQLTGWISPVKNLQKVAHFCDVLTESDLHLVLCSLDLQADKPESRYVLSKTIDYLLSGTISSSTKRCGVAELDSLLR